MASATSGPRLLPDRFEGRLTPKARLTRRQVSNHLLDLGYQVAETTLAHYAAHGGGPPYTKFGVRTFYIWADVLRWVKQREVRVA